MFRLTSGPLDATQPASHFRYSVVGYLFADSSLGRVLITIGPTGEKFWRPVPKAQTDIGVVDEGQWPRTVAICG